MPNLYHYLYKITNTLNNMIYIGIHSTDNLEDGYMGSGSNLQKAYQTIGKQYFKKEILEFFDTVEDARRREAEVVDKDFIRRKDVYNIVQGGGGTTANGTVAVKQNDGTYKRIPIEEYDRSIHETNAVGLVVVRTKESDRFYYIPTEEYHKNREKYITTGENSVAVEDEFGKKYRVQRDEFYKNREKYRTAADGMATYKDCHGNMYMVKKDDPRVLSGELVFLWKGLKHTEETKRKIGQKNAISNLGERNASYGTCWVYNIDKRESLRIKKEDLDEYLMNGWIKGRKMW